MTASRFKRRCETASKVRFLLDGETVVAQSGDTLAAALLAHDGKATRQTGPSNAQRTPFCMMGVCFDCLVEVDGRPNIQSCMIEVAEGMQVRRLSGFRKLESHDA